jgi:hypothetical protein
MVTINIGMGNNPVPFADIAEALNHMYPDVKVRLDRSSYNGVPEETLVAKAPHIDLTDLRVLCILLNQECIGYRERKTTTFEALIWNPKVAPHMTFDPNFFIDF